MRLGRPIAPLTLSEEEKGILEQWVRRPKTAQACRSEHESMCAEGMTNTAVAADLGVSKPTVGSGGPGSWNVALTALRTRHEQERPAVTDADVERVVTLTLETTPADATHWSTRSMSRHVGLGRNSISRIWRAFSLQPQRDLQAVFGPDVHRKGP